MFGVKEFHATALKKGIKPVIGCEMYVAKRSIADVVGEKKTVQVTIWSFWQKIDWLLRISLSLSLLHG